MLLVDGNHLASRCRHAIADLTTSTGQKSGVVHGVLQSISYAKSQYRLENTDIIVCWDGGRSAKRLEIFPDYKKRAPIEDAVAIDDQQQYYKQIEALRGGLVFRGIRQICVRGVEADDLLGIFSASLAKESRVQILTGDRDMDQLIDDRVTIINPKGDEITKQAALEKWDIPNLCMLTMYRAIVGDPSDNIRGVDGIGEVGGRKCVRHFFEHGRFLPEAESVTRNKKNIQRCVDFFPLIERNMMLMRLPRTWADSFYTIEQSDEANQQFSQIPEKDMSHFLTFLRSWELNSAVENIGVW